MAKKKAQVSEDAPQSEAIGFSFDGKKYKVKKGATIPFMNGAATLTAADIAADAEAQKYLVENGCSCIEEVIE